MSRSLQDPGLFRTTAYIDGQWVTTDFTSTIVNPATGETLAKVSRCGEREALAAIASAERAFKKWSRQTAKHRSEIIKRWYELLVAHQEDLATLITLEEGKPIAEARAEVQYASSFVQWFSEEAKRVYGDVIPAPRDNARIVVLKEPIGVCGAITPWNFPAAMITRKAAPALAAGCTMIVKPAGQTPLTALALAELGERAGLPKGVFNVVTGSHDDAATIGATLTSSDVVRKITFTGSTAVGRKLLAQSSATIKKCSMELGGNAPFIVFDDSDLQTAVEGLMVAKFRNTGQSCIGANRVLLQSGIHDAFAEMFLNRVRQLKVADGFEVGAEVGPLINAAAVRKVQEHVQDALAKGAKLLTGGRPHALGGCFFEPTILSDCNAGMRLSCEETFGPVAALFRFTSEADAIALANDTPYGLAAYLFSDSADRIWRVARELETGMLGINCGLISNEVAPFGGVKQSGLGREGSHYGIEEFMETKYLCWQSR